MENGKVYPVSETFVSPQGEGVYCGAVMAFVRLAGCTVGKPFPKERYVERYSTDSSERPLHLPIYTEQCSLYDGRRFACDTDYRVKQRMTAEEIVNEIPKDVKRVCITGGEPMMHDLSTLLSYLWSKFKKVHIETSGTIVPEWAFKQDVWITVSPKLCVKDEMLNRANELKILVDKDFVPDEKLLAISKSKPTYLQPINNENTIRGENVRLCMEWQKKYPAFRVSLQLHKVLSLYTEELVR
jgi:7-carboxy-7-deazaguanine synthase